MINQHLTDIHAHHPAKGHVAVISCSPAMYQDIKNKYPESYFSVGIHPWDTLKLDSPDIIKREFEILDRVAKENSVVAIGETGLDALKGASLTSQEAVFRHHIELSEQLCKPLVIHCVKAWDKLLALHKEYSPRQNWAIHGFRGKPELARQLVSRGIYLSLGNKFNSGILDVVPQEFILSETDESDSLPELPFETSSAIARFLTSNQVIT